MVGVTSQTFAANRERPGRCAMANFRDDPRISWAVNSGDVQMGHADTPVMLVWASSSGALRRGSTTGHGTRGRTVGRAPLPTPATSGIVVSRGGGTKIPRSSASSSSPGRCVVEAAPSDSRASTAGAEPPLEHGAVAAATPPDQHGQAVEVELDAGVVPRVPPRSEPPSRLPGASSDDRAPR